MVALDTIPEVEAAFAASEAVEPIEGEAEVAQRWQQELSSAEKWQERFVKRGKDIVRRYRNFDDDEMTGDRSPFNILWANIETLKPVLYSRTPKPQIAKRNWDEDDVGRVASQILERVTSFNLASYDFDEQMRRIVADYLLVGRGQAWLRYQPVVENGELVRENIYCDAVFWRDFLHSPARTWDEVRWVARRVYMTRGALVRRFGARGETVTLDHSPTEIEGAANPAGVPETFKRATIWEIWDKDAGEVIFLASGAKNQLLERGPPFINFGGFFPCPRPLLATTGATGERQDQGILPSPDFAFYKDQAKEIDRLSKRIGDLLKAVRLVGVYNAANKELGSLLGGGVAGNQMIPVADWPYLQQAGGLRGVMDFLPVEQAVNVLGQCYQARDQAKAAVYEITGISDIVRGETQAVETATAVQLKSRYGAVRVRERQGEVQRFARDVIRLMAEIVAEIFTPASLIEQSGIKLQSDAERQQIQAQQQQAALLAAQQQALAAAAAQAAPQQQAPPGFGPPEAVPGGGAAAPVLPGPGDQQAPPPLLPQPPQIPVPAPEPEEAGAAELPTIDQVVALLRNDKMRGFSIDIETDSTIAVDRQEQQASRLEFVKAVNDLLQGSAPLIQSAPELAPLVRELILYATRSYQVGGELEEQIEEALDAVGQRLSAPQQGEQAPPTDPALQQQAALAERQQQLAEQRLQLDAQIAQNEAQVAQLNAQAKLREIEIDGQLRMQQLQNEARRLDQNDTRLEISAQKANADALQAITPG